MLSITTLILFGGLSAALDIGGMKTWVSSQYNAWTLEPWQQGLKKVYPDAQRYQQATQELQALGTGDQDRLKAILGGWRQQHSNCEQLQIDSATVLVLWDTVPNQTTLTCTEVVATRKALAKLAGKPAETIALPFFTNTEKQHWEGYFNPLVAKAKQLSPALQGVCAKASTDYQQLDCLAKAAATPSAYQDTKSDLAYLAGACNSLGLDAAGCDSKEQEAAITAKMHELKTQAKQDWEKAQKQRQAALAPFAQFELAKPEYAALRQLLGLE